MDAAQCCELIFAAGDGLDRDCKKCDDQAVSPSLQQTCVADTSHHVDIQNEITNKSELASDFVDPEAASIVLSGDQCATVRDDGSHELTNEAEATVCDKVSNPPAEQRVGSPAVFDGDFIPPNEELVGKIITQMEYYFSDENLPTDKFLLQQISRNKKGWVSLKVISSFKKMKKLTRDFRVIAHALGQSEKLAVNETGTKVRRIAPLPVPQIAAAVQQAPMKMEEAILRTVVAVNLPSDQPTSEAVGELFSKCGKIVSVRIIRPGDDVPADVKKHNMKSHLEIGNILCALVEYERQENAKKACEIMTNKSDWRRGMRVTMLVPASGKDKDPKLPKPVPDDRQGDSDNSDDGKPRKKKKVPTATLR